MKRTFFLFGLSFLALAFVGAAVEVAARAMDSDLGWLPSIGTIWGTVSPASFQDFLKAYTWGGWPRLFSLPPLAVFGLPGLFLILVCRNQGEILDPEQEASLFLFDELAKRAREEDFSDLESPSTPGEQSELEPVAEPPSKRDFLLAAKAAPQAVSPKGE